MYWLVRLAYQFLGPDLVLKNLETRGDFRLAWELLAHEQLLKLRDDATFTYTYEYGLAELQLARYALAAGATEKAWWNAKSALAAFGWKGCLAEKSAKDARSIAAEASLSIDPLRLSDFEDQFSKASSEHFSLKELRFKEMVIREKPWLWLLASRSNRPRLWQRIP